MRTRVYSNGSCRKPGDRGSCHVEREKLQRVECESGRGCAVLSAGGGAASCLLGAGAPADLCQQLLESELVPTAQTDFTRHAYELSCAGEHGTFSAELAIDGGFLRNGPKEAALHELELELVEGSEEAFHAFAKDLETRFGLKVQPLSKLARAVAL